MFENPLKSLTFQSSNFGNEGSGFGTRPSITEQSGNSSNGTWPQAASNSSGTGNQNSLNSTGSLWGNDAPLDMANEQLDNEQWTELRSQIKQHWKNLSDQDLLMTQGNFEKLCNLIQQHSDQSREEIAGELRRLLNREPESEGSATLKRQNKMQRTVVTFEIHSCPSYTNYTSEKP